MADVAGILASGNIPQPPNPLETLGTIQSIVNARSTNNLLQQSLVNAQIQQQQGQQTLAKGYAGVAAGLGMAVALDPHATPDKARSYIDSMESLYGHSPAFDAVRQRITDNMSTEDVNRIGREIAYLNTSPEVQQRMASPSVDWRSNGASQVPFQTYAPGNAAGAPAGVPMQAGGGITQQLSPSEGSDILTVRMPDGSDRQVTRQQLADQQLLAHGARVMPPVSAQPAAPNAPPASAAPAPSPAPASTTPAIPFGGQLPTEGQTALSNASRAKDAQDMANLTSRNYNDMKYSLETIRNLSPNVTSGHGTERLNIVKQIVSNMAPNVARTFGIDPDKATDQQDMYKALARAAAASGNRSDADLFQSIASNPNAEMSPAALQRAAGYVLALNAQESVLTQAAHEEARHQPLDTNTQNPAVRLRIQNGLDPNAFRSAYMGDKEWTDYKAGLDAKGRDKLAKTFDLMDRYLPQPSGGLQPTVAPASKP